MPIPLAAIGLGIQGAGLLAKLFGKSDEEIRQERIAKLRGQITAAKAKTLAEGSRLINEQTVRNQSLARQGGAARAIAMGRGNQAEDFAVPGEQRALTAGSESLRGFTADTNRAYDNQLLAAESEFAQRPISPDVGDYLIEGGDVLAQYGQGKEMLDLYKNPTDAEFEDISNLGEFQETSKLPPPQFEPRQLPSWIGARDRNAMSLKYGKRRR